MVPEVYCARLLGAIEGEEFIAVGDAVAEKLNPNYERDLRLGRAVPLPDLLSTCRSGDVSTYRLREVKFKLHEKTIGRALEQLRSGVRHLRRGVSECPVDRLEIVVPLRGRRLKSAERLFLGKPLGPGRFRLSRAGSPVSLRISRRYYQVSVVLL